MYDKSMSYSNKEFARLSVTRKLFTLTYFLFRKDTSKRTDFVSQFLWRVMEEY